MHRYIVVQAPIAVEWVETMDGDVRVVRVRVRVVRVRVVRNIVDTVERYNYIVAVAQVFLVRFISTFPYANNCLQNFSFLTIRLL